MQQTLSRGQRGVTDSLVARDLARARELQKVLDGMQRLAERRFALDATILSLAGYHRKNAYMAKHWDAIQAGRPPKDPLLVKQEIGDAQTIERTTPPSTRRAAPVVADAPSLHT